MLRNAKMVITIIRELVPNVMLLVKLVLEVILKVVRHAMKVGYWLKKQCANQVVKKENILIAINVRLVKKIVQIAMMVKLVLNVKLITSLIMANVLKLVQVEHLLMLNHNHVFHAILLVLLALIILQITVLLAQKNS